MFNVVCLSFFTSVLGTCVLWSFVSAINSTLIIYTTWVNGLCSGWDVFHSFCAFSFADILRNEVAWFDIDENNSGQISSRLSADATTVKGAIGERISLIIQNTTLMIATLVIALKLQWRMALVFLATFPLLVFAAIVEVNWIKLAIDFTFHIFYTTLSLG